jgi:hypothetical protein
VRSCATACTEQSDGEACLVASVAYSEGIGVRKDLAAMQTFERRACELGVMLGCEYYANNFLRSRHEDEQALAREHYERACEGGRMTSCAGAGAMALRLDAEGKPRDPRAALERYTQACDGGVTWACDTAGDLLTFGIGTTPDRERAAESFRKACEAKSVTGCHNLQEAEEHWLSGATDVLIDALHSPEPMLVPQQLPASEPVRVVTRTCVTQGALEPVRVRVIESSGQKPIDAQVIGTLQGWRIRVRPGWTVDRPVCVLNVFDIRAA